MQIVDLILAVHTSLAGFIGNYRAQSVHRLPLLGVDLVRMDLVLARYFLNGLVAAQRLKLNHGLEIPGKLLLCRHLVFLRQKIVCDRGMSFPFAWVVLSIGRVLKRTLPSLYLDNSIPSK